MSTASSVDPMLTARLHDCLKRAGNPFRNYFARNPDDEVCARYHVPELFAAERNLLHAIIDLYRYDPNTHSEVVPILGNKGAGKTHLLHSIKHAIGGQWQLLVTPGVYQKDTDFLEYLLFQIIDTLLGGGRQQGTRPISSIGDVLVRQQLVQALQQIPQSEQCELFPPPGLGKWGRRLGLGTSQASERCQWLAENLSGRAHFGRAPVPLAQALADAGLTVDRAFDLVIRHTSRTESRNTAGLMRQNVLQGFARAVLLGDESELANFLTYGFAELDFQVRPTRQDLVLALFKVLTELFRSLQVPVVVAFDQLEDLLLARRADDAHKTAESFFAGIVQVMHQIDGLCFLIFAERGLWNRFVPSMDGYIQDRLNNPVHVPQVGTVKAIRLEAPTPDLVTRVVDARLQSVYSETSAISSLPDLYPFSGEQVNRIARTEPTLRDMLQQFRHLFDHLVYGPDDALPALPVNGMPNDMTTIDLEPTPAADAMATPESTSSVEVGYGVSSPHGSDSNHAEYMPPVTAMDDEPLEAPKPWNRITDADNPLPTAAEDKWNRINALLGNDGPTENQPPKIKSVTVVESTSPPETETAEEVPSPEPFPAAADASLSAPVLVNPSTAASSLSFEALGELWDQEFRAARRKLEPDGALTGATRELQAALGSFLTTCHEHGVKVGPWRLQHVVPEWPFGEHPTYGVVSLAHWACKDGQPWRVGIGLFLARGGGKPKDLEIKLAVMGVEPQVLDHLILLRQEDDISLTGKSKTLWSEAEQKGQHARLEAVSLDGFAQLYSFPRWLASVRESLPEGTPLPNLADLIQEKAETLLTRVCMPVN